MLDLLRKLLGRDPPLAGTGTSGRPKTYSADSGYVYQYTFTGFRRIVRKGEHYIEYVFSVTAGRGEPSPVSVLLAELRLPEWSGRHRELTASERYGIAKVCLKRALDRLPHPASIEPQVVPGPAEIAEIAETLDL